MSKFLLNSFLIGSAILGAALAVSAPAIAAEPDQTAPVASSSDTPLIDQINRYSLEGKPFENDTAVVGQVTSVSQLTDVRPTDWAFQALQSLVERYGCIVGYPDKTYRGNRALTRYEFAAGLNACLDKIQELIAAATADFVKKEDLEVVKRLQEEFASELSALRGRVESLEVRTATLEKQQFSVTTKLSGEVVFAVTDEFNNSRENNTVFQDRVRLTLKTSFTGKDLLITRLRAANARFFNLAGNGVNVEGLQTFNLGNTTNSVDADWIAYYFQLNDRVSFYVPAVFGFHADHTPTLSPVLDTDSGATGPLSVFAEKNPIYDIGGGSGLSVKVKLAPSITVNANYLADNSPPTGSIAFANNPASKNGLFDGSYSALGQLTFQPNDKFGIGLTYVNAYRRSALFDLGSGGTGVLGTLYAAQGRNLLGAITPAKVNAYGVSAVYSFSPKLVINAFGSYISADFVNDGVDERDIWTYGLGIALPDFGRKGNLLGVVAGAIPYLGNPTAIQRAGGAGNDIPIHLEAFYKYQLNDNISITPGVIYIINPGQNENNDDTLIGTVRTTFTF
ncbi:iron uptake porin [Phormidium sp. CLA17]|uniref:iron uptake porin n=1 Tax=Leptolyngbya sp. Cla-17 TaxID=2803751 RepID=UPI001490E0A8|nr:iron uptake porin [Leptolyngbya sp. Cla-17]MBM0744014.1 iron uptake porin [Leptolyngbya sp. Cla-17]